MEEPPMVIFQGQEVEQDWIDFDRSYMQWRREAMIFYEQFSWEFAELTPGGCWKGIKPLSDREKWEEVPEKQVGDVQALFSYFSVVVVNCLCGFSSSFPSLSPVTSCCHYNLLQYHKSYVLINVSYI